MATYLPDIAPYVPDIQPFTPDYSFLQKALSIKQQRYDSAYNSINSSLSDIQNSELFTEESIAKRENYLKDATNKLKKLSETDLSLPENQAAAEQIFAPFWQDTGLLHEKYVGKKINSELTYAESLRNSHKPGEADMYSQESIVDIQNFKKEYAEASPEERLSMSPRRFTKKVEVVAEMNKAVKDLGLSGTVKESVDGTGYKFVNTNGEESVIPFLTFFKSNLSEDARTYLQMKGRVQGRQALENAMQITGSKESALNLIGEELIGKELNSLTTKIIPELKSKIEYIDSRAKGLAELRTSQGSEMTKEDEALIAQWAEAKSMIQKQLDSQLDQAKSLVTVESISDDGMVGPDATLNKESEEYQKRLSRYRVNYGQAYGAQLVEGYANAWANSMASFSSKKVEADVAYKNIMDIQKDQAALMLKDQIAEEANDTKLTIAEMKAGKKTSTGTKTGTGTTTDANGELVDVSGKNQPVYVGAGVTGSGKISPKESQDATKKILAAQIPVASVTLFSKMFSDLDFSKGFMDEIAEKIINGKGKDGFKPGEDLNKLREYVKNKQIKVTKNLRNYEDLYEALNQNIDETINTKLETNPYAYKDLMGDIDNRKNLAKAYKDVMAVEKEVSTKILSGTSFTGFTKDGPEGTTALIETRQEYLKKNENNKVMVYPKIQEQVSNPLSHHASRMKNPAYQPEYISINGVRRKNPNYNPNVPEMITLPVGQSIQSRIDKNPVMLTEKDLYSVKDGGNLISTNSMTAPIIQKNADWPGKGIPGMEKGAVEVVIKDKGSFLVSKPDYERIFNRQDPKKFEEELSKVKKNYEEKFNSVAPVADISGNLNAFNIGNLKYTTMDPKDNNELAEVGVVQLLTEQNLSKLSERVKGDFDSDLVTDKTKAEIMKTVLRRVAGSAQEIDGLGLTLHGYDTDFGKESYSITVPEAKMKTLFTTDELKDWKQYIDAVPLMRFKADEAVGVSSANKTGIKTSYTMFERQVRDKPYQTDEFFDKAKIGGFKIKPLPGAGGYEATMWYYPYDTKTGLPQAEKVMSEEGRFIIPMETDMEWVRSNLFDLMQRRGAVEYQKAKSNPPAPKGTGTPVADVLAKYNFK